MNNIIDCLKSAKRNTAWGAVPDPIAQDILHSKSLNLLEKELSFFQFDYFLPLAGGLFNFVIDTGEYIIRVGLGKLEKKVNLIEILQPIYCAEIGNLKYEILPKVNTTNVTLKDLNFITNQLEKQGYQWKDAGIDNIGLYNGKIVIIDAEGIKKSSPKLTPKTK